MLARPVRDSLARLACLASILAALVVSPRSAAPQSPPEAGYLAVDSSRLYYEECGTGPTIVLSHDGAMGASTWDAVWPDLCARFHVLRYDRRGVGRSSAPKVAFSQSDDLDALLTNRRVSRATLVGSSGGGAIAVNFTLEHPEKVERLVLLGPVLHGMAFSEHFLTRDLGNLEPARRGDARAAAEHQANDRYMLAPGDSAVRRKLFETLLANPQNLRSAFTNGQFERRAAVPAAVRLHEVRVPTLILVGEYDIPDVHAHAGAIELGIWGARREIVRGAGHLLQLEQPAPLRDKISAFIAETPFAVVPAERLEAYAGTYTPLVRDQPGSFYVREGRLMLRFAGVRDIPLFPASDSSFYALSAQGLRVTFVRGPDGRTAAADISIGGAVHRAMATRDARRPGRS